MKTQLLIWLVQLRSKPCMVSCDNRMPVWNRNDTMQGEVKFCCHWKKGNCGVCTDVTLHKSRSEEGLQEDALSRAAVLRADGDSQSKFQGYLLTQSKTYSVLSSPCPTQRSSSHLKNKTSNKTRAFPFLCTADFPSRHACFRKFFPCPWGEPGNVQIQ